jgi:hypothetical protein
LALVTAPEFNDGIVAAARIDQVSTATNQRTPLHAIKSSTEVLASSTTLQNDDALLVAVEEGAIYSGLLVAYIQSAANAAGDMQIGFSFPALSTMHFGGVGPHNTLASGTQVDGEFVPRLSATSGVTAISYGCSTAGVTALINFDIVVGSAGILQVMWAQMASNANESRMLLGSKLIGWRCG